jgi:hypothetical protein
VFTKEEIKEFSSFSPALEFEKVEKMSYNGHRIEIDTAAASF